MSDAAVLGLILQSALRSLVLGASVLALVKLVRLRDLGAETAIWSAVLGAALAMPLLSAWLPGLAIRLPSHPSAPPASVIAAASAHPAWIASHAGALLLGAWALIAAAGLARLAVGLLLTARLHREAEPIVEPWTGGRDIRETGAVDAPLSFARAILLPLDWRDWSAAKLQAVLAHETCHVGRGDFFILLIASVHRAFFWFSPFAWWLQARLGELAETASDKAATRTIADPAGYAEILVEVTRRAQRMPMPAMAMARGPGVARRIDQILAGVPEKTLGRAGRTIALAGVLVLSFGLAEVRAAVYPEPDAFSDRPSPPPRARTAGPRPRSRAAAVVSSSAAARVVHSPTARAVKLDVATAPAAAPSQDAFTYDPRALLEEPDAAVLPAVILAGHRAAAGADD